MYYRDQNTQISGPPRIPYRKLSTAGLAKNSLSFHSLVKLRQRHSDWIKCVYITIQYESREGEGGLCHHLGEKKQQKNQVILMLMLIPPIASYTVVNI